MKRNFDGFMLYEVLLALFILTVCLLFILESMVFLMSQSRTRQNILELSILASEIVRFDLTLEDSELLDKCDKQQIKIIESGDQRLVLEKGGDVLDISKK